MLFFKSLAPSKSYDQIQATLNLLFADDLEFDTIDVISINSFFF
jgi:hypothetical protein